MLFQIDNGKNEVFKQCWFYDALRLRNWMRANHEGRCKTFPAEANARGCHARHTLFLTPGSTF